MTEIGQDGWWSKPLRVTTWWGRLLIGRNPAVTVVRLVVLVALSSVLFKGVLIPVRVTGKSMEPTYRDGRVNFINRLAYHRDEPQRGDVVGLRRAPSRLLVLKRIVGLPGERISIRQGRVFIDGDELEEDYTDGQPIPPTSGERLLNEEEYFVIGDNRDLSAYAVVERGDILGKVLF
jgi:signal peptidase I